MQNLLCSYYGCHFNLLLLLHLLHLARRCQPPSLLLHRLLHLHVMLLLARCTVLLPLLS
jgi:hypothetical protein